MSAAHLIACLTAIGPHVAHLRELTHTLIDRLARYPLPVTPEDRRVLVLAAGEIQVLSMALHAASSETLRQLKRPGSLSREPAHRVIGDEPLASQPTGQLESADDKRRFERNAYQREYMRRRRAKLREARVERTDAQKED